MTKIAIAFIIIVSFAGTVIAQELTSEDDGSVRSIDARAFIPDGPARYLATKEAVYRSRIPENIWAPVFVLSEGDNEIMCIALDHNGIFIGTKHGIFRKALSAQATDSASRSIVGEKYSVLCITPGSDGDNRIYIGTQRGVFASSDRGDSWKDIGGVLANTAVKSIALHKGYIFAAAGDGLYVMNDSLAGGWDRLITGKLIDEGSDDPDPAMFESPEDEAISIRSCIISNSDVLYAGIGKNVFFSSDGGKGWLPLTRNGLAGYVNGILAMNGSGKIFCATTKGVFEYCAGASIWKELYRGADRRLSIKDVVVTGDDESAVLGVTDNGLYRYEVGRYYPAEYSDVGRNIKAMRVSQADEPSFAQLRLAAIKYCDVCPEKIDRWHRESRMRALLPKVSFGMNRDRSTNSTIYTSATKDYVAVGPDDISDGWDMSLSWELGGLIWSDNQTNIDVRSKLMVQLRNDILDDLRRAYYERKRLQFEIASGPLIDEKINYEKEIRIEELTQVIDDLTGNFFSDHRIAGKQAGEAVIVDKGL